MDETTPRVRKVLVTVGSTLTAVEELRISAGSNVTLTATTSNHRTTLTIAATGGGGGSSDHATLTHLDYASSGHTGFTPSARTVTAGTGLSGGGDLSADRTLSLASGVVTPTTKGSASKSPTVTVDTYGRVTSLSDQDIAIAWGQITSGISSASPTFAGLTISGNGTVNGNLHVAGNLQVDGEVIEATSTVVLESRYIYQNTSYTTAVAQTTGVARTYLPTSTATTATAFTLGVAGVSDPVIGVASSSGFAASDLIEVSGSASNDGFYEVQATGAGTLTLRGVGLHARVEDWTRNQLAVEVVSGTVNVVKVNVAVERTGTDGIPEHGAGSATGITYYDYLLASTSWGGDLSGTGASPTVTQARGLRETSGPTTLTMGAVSDGQALVRSGSTVIGAGRTLTRRCDDLPTILATSPNAHYERHPNVPSLIRLGQGNTFPNARTVAAASPEYGWVWANRTNLASANENTATASAVHGVATATNTDWGSGTQTNPFRYVTFQWDGHSVFEAVGRFYSNGNASYESTGMCFCSDSSPGALHYKVLVGYISTGVGIHAYNGASSFTTATVTLGQRDAGVWFRILVMPSNDVYVYYSTSSASTPPSSWTFLVRWTNVLNSWATYRIGQMWQTTDTAAHLTGGCKWWGARFLNSDLAGAMDLPWQANQLASTGDTLKLIASWDAGTPVTPSQAQLRLRLADAINRLPADAATWTFGCTGSASANPAAPTTLQAAASLTLKDAGTDTPASSAYRYWALYAQASSSGGTQPASLDTALICLET